MHVRFEICTMRQTSIRQLENAVLIQKCQEVTGTGENYPENFVSIVTYQRRLWPGC